MPMGSAPLSAELKTLLKKWIEASMPESSNSGGGTNPIPEPPAPPLEATYRSLSFHVFQPKCVLCHSSARAADGVRLDTYENIVQNGDLIDRERADHSDLYKVLIRRRMPPVNSKVEELTQEEISMVYEWIRRGTPK